MRTAGQILDRVIASLGLSQKLKEMTLMNLWPVVAGPPFDTRSKPLFLDNEGNLVIAVENAAIAQELSLAKLKIVKPLRQTARSLGIHLNNLRIDLKHFHNYEPDIEFSSGRPGAPLPRPTESEIEATTLTPADIREVEELKEKLAASEQTAYPERVIKLFERELKLRNWRQAKGLPQCQVCNVPLAIPTATGLCPPCYFARSG